MRAKRWSFVLGLVILIPSMSVNANEILKEDWINGMTTALPTAFCKSDQWFRRCFTVTQAECEEVALSATRICLKNNNDRIPTRLKQPEDGKKWGTIIGSCAGSAYEITLQSKRISNAKCNDLNNWK